MLGELLRSTAREERLSLAWLLKAVAGSYKHLPSRAMSSVNSHVEGAEKSPHLVGHKNAFRQTWSEAEGGKCVCTGIARGTRLTCDAPLS